MKTFSLDLVTIRPMTQEDESLIYSTWIRGLYYGNSWFRQIPKHIFTKNYHPVITRLLKRPGVSVKVMCLQEDSDVILAYIVLETATDGEIIHWIYTRSVWRNLGIANALIPSNVIAVTHLTKIAMDLKPEKWVFNPFLV